MTTVRVVDPVDTPTLRATPAHASVRTAKLEPAAVSDITSMLQALAAARRRTLAERRAAAADATGSASEPVGDLPWPSCPRQVIELPVHRCKWRQRPVRSGAARLPRAA